MCSFSSRFSASLVRDFGIVKRYSWLWKSLNIADRGSESSFFPRFSCKNWYRNWYLHVHKTYDQQISQEGTSRGVDSNKTNQAYAGDAIMSRSRYELKQYISTTTMSMATKHGRMVTNFMRLLLIMLLYPLIMWFCQITWQTKTIYLHYHDTYDHQTQQGCELPWGGSTHKVRGP